MRFLILPKQDFGMTVSYREQGGMKLSSRSAARDRTDVITNDFKVASLLSTAMDHTIVNRKSVFNLFPVLIF